MSDDLMQGLGQFRVDSQVVGSRTAFALWHQMHAALFEPNAYARDAVDTFVLDLSACHAGRMVLGQAIIPSERYDRSSPCISRDGIDHYLLILSEEGRFFGQSGGRPFDLGSGDLILFSLGVVGEAHSEVGRCMAMVMPRAILAPLLAAPDELSGTVLRRGTPYCDILFNHLRGLLANAGRMALSDGPGLAASTAAMIAVCFGPASGGGREQSLRLRTASLVAIKAYIDANLASTDLNARHLCDVFGLSRAVLYRLFEPLVPVAEFIRRRRLGGALLALSVTPVSGAHIEATSRAFGFSSGASFSRAFKAAYGVNPSDIRGDLTDLAKRLDRNLDSDDAPLARWLHGLA